MKKANISLTTVIVVGAVLFLIGATLMVSTLDLLSATKGFAGMQISQVNARSCLEESLAKIKTNPAYTGTNSVTLATGTCSFSITNYQNNVTQKLIVLTGQYNGTKYQMTKLADISQSPYQISNP
jgi:hypothetical protein